MMKRKTIAELSATIARLEPIEAAYYAMRRGAAEVTIESGEHSATILAIDGCHGGIVVAVNGEPVSPMWLSERVGAWSRPEAGPYFNEISRKAIRAQSAAIEARYAARAS